MEPVGVIGTCCGCFSFFFSNWQTLRQHLFDFDENKKKFEEKKSEVEAKKADYENGLRSATTNNMKAKNDVVNWDTEYREKIKEWDRLGTDLKGNSGRRCCPCKIKLNKKLLKMTKQITELIDRYNKFQGSMFTEDLNSKIVADFEDTKYKFENLTASISLEEVEIWRLEYEEMKGKLNNCDIGNMDDLEKMTTEMKVLIHRHNQFFSFQKIKKGFDAMIKTYNSERKSAENDGKIPTELVRQWMDDCEKLQKKYGRGNTEIQAEGESSHRQEQNMEEMNNLINRYKDFHSFSNMFVDQPLKTVEKRSTEYKHLKSMEQNKKNVYAALKDEMVIRLFGMGGVGKTTLMNQINNEMSDGKDFKFVIWVTVSNTFADIKSIQNQIYNRLKLKWYEREDHTVRAMKISEFLKSSVDGNVLFIFDDVWKMLDLNAIGIPVATYGGGDGRKCCKIILTTRDSNVKVIHPMPPKDIMMKGLDEDESWILFKINASIEDNIDDGIKELAEKICRKCAGLPLVIEVIAKMLHKEEEKAIWSETLTHLNKKDASRYISNLSNDVYIPLRLSYDRLEREDWKIGFLLCSLFPEDRVIELSDLFIYGIGAGEIAENCQSSDSCHRLFIHLKNKGLLQDGVDGVRGKDSARMHDIIRDVAHFIAKKEFGGFFCNAELTKWIYSVPNSSLGMENVLSLDLRQTSMTSQQAETTMSFIKTLKELRVLMFHPYFPEILMNIKEYFILHDLSVLHLQGVYIKELDKDFSRELCNLRVIDFSGTVIDVIRSKVFSNLYNKLEVLQMHHSFNKWQASDENGDYMRFAELAEFKKLYLLQVDIKEMEIFSHEYRPDLIFSSVKYFSIRPVFVSDDFHTSCYWWDCKMILPHFSVWNGANWIKDWFKKTEDLTICENDISNVRCSGLKFIFPWNVATCLVQLKVLFIFSCDELEVIIEKEDIGDYNNKEEHVLFPELKEMYLSGLPKLEYVFSRSDIIKLIPKGSFEKLKYISIVSCPGLKYIFPWNVATCLVQLEVLNITSCDELEVIIEKEDIGDYNNKEEHVLFPELKEMYLSGLPKLEYVFSRSDIIKLIPKGSFEKLKYISIDMCLRLKFILEIEDCEELEVIVEKEDNGDYNNQGEHVLFPELTKMHLTDLPKLEYVLSRSDKKLKNLKQLLLGESSAPNLKLVYWDGKEFVDE